MCYFIGIESLAAGALIELLKRGEHSVSFAALEQYGNEVVKVLNGQKSGLGAVLILSRERTHGFIRDCSEFFIVENPDSPEGKISLKNGVTVEMVAREFCGAIPVPVLRALADDASVNVLLTAA